MEISHHITLDNMSTKVNSTHDLTELYHYPVVPSRFPSDRDKAYLSMSASPLSVLLVGLYLHFQLLHVFSAVFM
jgi:hypothetical protein